jgi:hypothetical protein
MSCFLHCAVSFCGSGGILNGVFAFRMLEINWLLQCVMRAASAIVCLYAGSINPIHGIKNDNYMCTFTCVF